MPRSIQYSEKYNDELYEYRYGGPRSRNPSPPRTSSGFQPWGCADDKLTNQGPLIQTWCRHRVFGELRLEAFGALGLPLPYGMCRRAVWDPPLENFWARNQRPHNCGWGVVEKAAPGPRISGSDVVKTSYNALHTRKVEPWSLKLTRYSALCLRSTLPNSDTRWCIWKDRPQSTTGFYCGQGRVGRAQQASADEYSPQTRDSSPRRRKAHTQGPPFD